VIDATDFTTAFGSGQLKEHLYLCRGLGVQQILCVVNKMDLCGWSQRVYDDICGKLSSFLMGQAGYAANMIRFVPCAGLTGVNLVHVVPDKSKEEDAALLTAWYKGPTVWQALDGFDCNTLHTQTQQQREQRLSKPLRILLQDVTGEQGKGVSVRAKVAQGWIQQGESVTVLPVGDVAVISKLTSLQNSGNSGSGSGNYNNNNNKNVADRQKYAVAGEMVDLVVTGVDIVRLSAGSLLARAGSLPVLASQCRAKVWILEGLTIPIIRGASCIFHMHQLDVPCHLTHLVRTLQKDGSPGKERPRALTANTQAVIEIKLMSPIAMEAFSDCRALGRFVLRRGGDSIGVGRIEKVLQ
jgi:elongation factor 1 alpha-like protein